VHVERSNTGGSEDFRGNDLWERGDEEEIRLPAGDISHIDERNVETPDRIASAPERTAEPFTPTAARPRHHNGDQAMITPNALQRRFGLRAAASECNHPQCGHIAECVRR
jgi:hypothetical protein